MAFTVQKAPEAEEQVSKKKANGKNYKIEQIMNAEDLSETEFEELSQNKKAGKTTTAENFKVEKQYWQNFFLTNDLDEGLLKNFMFDENPPETSLR
jgi:hypothetical protein